jgi:tetratricopeptide (TPR) repeat protein
MKLTEPQASRLLGLFLVLATLAVYFPAMHAGYIWDDDFYLTDNPLIKLPDGLRRLWFTTEPEEYYPLTYTTWWLEWRLWGTNARGYHATNVFLHAVNSLLVWAVLRALRVRGAWLAALVFAVHPVNVASVAWISERKNTLSLLFYLLALLSYLRFEDRSQLRWYALSLGAFLLALCSKTAVVMLPFVLLGCDWWRRGAITRRDVLRSAPYFLLSLIFGLVTMWFQHHRALGGRIVREEGFLTRLAEAGWSVWFYLYKALVPFQLSMIYPRWDVKPCGALAFAPLLGAIFVLLWRYRQRFGRGPLFSLGYFVITLLPVLGFIDQGFYDYSLVADHWQYAAILGPIAFMVAGASHLCREWTLAWKRALGGLVVAVLSVASWRHCHVYQNQETLWRDTLAKNPKAWIAYNNLGVALRQQGRGAEALTLYEESLRLRPNYRDAHNNLGVALDALGQTDRAAHHFSEALRLHPRFADAHNNLGLIRLREGRFSEAMTHFAAALEAKPGNAHTLNNLGAAHRELGRVPEATEFFRQVLQMKPDFVEAHSNLAAALAAQGLHIEAIGHFAEALRLRPDDPEGHNNLGVSLAQSGRLREAVHHFQEALRLRPDYPEARHNLAVARSETSRGDESLPAPGNVSP